MPAFASIEIVPGSLSRDSTPLGVYRYNTNGDPKYEYLQNVKVLSIQYREGADPGAARFRYVFDSKNPATDPISFQEVLATESELPGVVKNDDRLVVFTPTPNGSSRALFDGFAQVPELDLSPTGESVTFQAFGVAIREWDTPIGGALMRNADSPTIVSDATTDLEVHFNPAGNPNATPRGADASDHNNNTYPTFLDPLVVRNPDVRRKWTLSMAARYLCYHHNPKQDYVVNPDGALLDVLLDSRAPSSGAMFQPDDPSTFTSQSILVPDYPATGKVWPAVLNDLLEPNGFGMAFRLDTDGNGDPFTTLEVFRRQDGVPGTYKDLYLQAYGSSLDPCQTNMGEAHLARDISAVANSYTVESGLVRYEASFVLAPGYPISPSDADPTALGLFDRNDPNFRDKVDKYRLYVFDETGEGHWDYGTGSIRTTAPPLDAILGGLGDNRAGFVRRRRVPIAELFTVDQNQIPLKAQLSISTNYAGPLPGLWDGTGTWQTITGGFELLADRLGVWINTSNPNGWHIGASRAIGAPYPAGVVRGVEDQALSGATRFALRLTCVIEGDRTVSATAARRPSSPTLYTITRRVDARDRYTKNSKASKSEFNTTSADVLSRDDSPDALADANARRLANEAGVVSGSVTIPRFTAAYRVGDKIRSIRGRELSLRTNSGTPTTEAAVFPAIVGMTWEFDGKQNTVLHLSDQRGGGR
ncbi:MAG: hypothetical protein NVSMB9_15880 [Isosphaeraceae bacterium]